MKFRNSQSPGTSSGKFILYGACFWLLASGFWAGCGGDDEIGIPRPRAYFRIDFPEKEYKPFNESCPFTFDLPSYAKASQDQDPGAQPCWLNIDFPQYKGALHLTYLPLNNNLAKCLEDSRTLAIKHQVKADAIDERLVIDDTSKVWGLVYDIEGNAASNVQFYLTDSVHHFIRGALYFTAKPNKDSLEPVVKFIRQDVFRLIDSFRWKEATPVSQR